MSDVNAEHDQKATERRQSERIADSIPAVFTLETRPCPCVVLNMSEGGLLLKFDQQPALSPSEGDIGKTGSVVFGVDTSQKSLRGRIIRTLMSDNICVVAISLVG